jgi:LPS-assembly protein
MHRISLSYHQDFYHLRKQGNFTDNNYQKDYFQFDTYSTLLLEKSFPNFSHLLKPYFSYTFRTKPSSENTPVFDEEDKQNKKINRIEYGIWNYFYTSSHPNLIVFRAYQQYDFTLAHRSPTETSPEKRALSDLFWELSVNMAPRLSLRYDGSYNFYGLGLKKHSFNLTLRSYVIELISLGYQEDRAWNTKQLNLSLGHHLTPSLYASFFLSRNLKKGENSVLRFFINYTKTATALV